MNSQLPFDSKGGSLVQSSMGVPEIATGMKMDEAFFV